MVFLWEKVLRPTAKWFAVASAVLCGALALLLTAEVVMRGVGSGSIRGLFEIAELGLVMTVFLGMAQSEINGTHVRVTLLTDRLSPAAAARVRGIGLVIAAIFLAWMSYELIGRAIESFAVGEFRTGLLNFPTWPSRGFVAVGSAFLAIVILAKGIISLMGRTPSGVENIEGGAV